MPIPSHILELQQLEVRAALSKLREFPSLTLSDIGHEDSCAICLLLLDSLIKEGRTTEPGSHFVETEDGSLREQMVGVVKLDSCGHIFCRKDLAEWVESRHGTCPACRRPFFEFSHFDEDEYESSDGGEYVPEDDVDEEDYFTDDDGFLPTTSDFEGEDMSSEAEDNTREHALGSPIQSPISTSPANPTSGRQIQSSTRSRTSSPRSHTSAHRVHPYNASRASPRHDRANENHDEEEEVPARLIRPLRHGRFRVVEPYPVGDALPRAPRANGQSSASSTQEVLEDATMLGFDDSDLPTGLLSSGGSSERFSLGSDDFEALQSADEAVIRSASPSYELSSVQLVEVKLPPPSSSDSHDRAFS